MDERQILCDRACEFIRGGTSPSYEEVIRLAKDLARHLRFDYARRLIHNYRRDLREDKLPAGSRPPENADPLVLAQRHSLYTYKDPDLPAADRLEMAWAILKEADDPDRSTNQETLGLGGAIWKRQWELDGQRAHLERSLQYYDRAYRRGVASDDGYTAVNTAFVHDLLGDLEAAQAGQLPGGENEAERHRARAREIRVEIVTVLEAKKAKLGAGGENLKWLHASLAEAFFGLGRYPEAGKALEAFVDSQPDEWEKDSAARQLGRLCFLQSRGEPPSPAVEKALGCLLGPKPGVVHSAFIGKVGLALSGGGFRASLFHLGVLARLAELHLLRYVEVISCVSGGSIVGAHYYLALQQRLEEKEDGELGQKDYVALVEEVATTFLAGVQKNLRLRLVTNPLACLKMAFLPAYSHTDRAGELFERYLYQDIGKNRPDKRFMHELKVQPKGAAPGFNPRRENWRRADKVPILALNATTLNTGHNWQFTATWMGEPPGDLGTGVDANDWLRRMPLEKAPPKHREVRLGYAVAASACVPGLFRPLERPGLYRGWNVRLVDGGVHDNQGVATLLEQECTVMLVSDASGQSPSQKEPAASALSVPIRANDILMGRVRVEQHRRLATLKAAGRLRDLMFIHLRRGLAPEPVDWEGCDEGAKHFLDDYGTRAARGAGGAECDMRVPTDVQRLLAGLRTDLDSFCDVEAYALMTSGYRQTECFLPRQLRSFAASEPTRPWFFLQVEELFSAAGEPTGRNARLTKVLATGQSRAFKVFRLSRLAWIVPALLLLGGMAVLWSTYPWWSTRYLPLSSVIVAGGVAVLLAVLSRIGEAWKNTLLSLPRRLMWGVMALLAWLFVGIHLLTLDRVFLREGRMGLDGPHHR